MAIDINVREWEHGEPAGGVRGAPARDLRVPPASCHRVAPASDLSSLYSSLSGKLEQIIQREIADADCVVEDACQFAWTQLARKRQSWPGWLALHRARRSG
jgi:hypothetical protein